MSNPTLAMRPGAGAIPQSEQDAVWSKINWRVVPIILIAYIMAFLDRINVGYAKLTMQQDLDLDPAKLNVHGGAIALGHPLGATGVRLTITVARQLRDIGARWGIASACVGGGQGIALLIENPAAA